MPDRVPLAQLQDAAEKATEGAWELSPVFDASGKPKPSDAVVKAGATDGLEVDWADIPDDAWIAWDLKPPDATHIAAADPSTVTALCRALRLAREALDEISLNKLGEHRGALMVKATAAFNSLETLVDFNPPDAEEENDG